MPWSNLLCHLFVFALVIRKGIRFEDRIDYKRVLDQLGDEVFLGLAVVPPVVEVTTEAGMVCALLFVADSDDCIQHCALVVLFEHLVNVVLPATNSYSRQEVCSVVKAEAKFAMVGRFVGLGQIGRASCRERV